MLINFVREIFKVSWNGKNLTAVKNLDSMSLLGLYSGEEGRRKRDINYKTMLNLDNTLYDKTFTDIIFKNGNNIINTLKEVNNIINNI
jgi:hypothetical protein